MNYDAGIGAPSLGEALSGVCALVPDARTLLCLKEKEIVLDFGQREWKGSFQKNQEEPFTITEKDLQEKHKVIDPRSVVVDLSVNGMPSSFHFEINPQGCTIYDPSDLTDGKNILTVNKSLRFSCVNKPTHVDVNVGTLKGTGAAIRYNHEKEGMQHATLDISNLREKFDLSMTPADVKGGLMHIIEENVKQTLVHGARISLAGRDFLMAHADKLRVRSALLDMCQGTARLLPDSSDSSKVTLQIDQLPCVFVKIGAREVAAKAAPGRWNEVGDSICAALADGFLCPTQRAKDIKFMSANNQSITLTVGATPTGGMKAGIDEIELKVESPVPPPPPSFVLMLTVDGFPTIAGALRIPAPAGCQMGQFDGPASTYMFNCTQEPSKSLTLTITDGWSGKLTAKPTAVAGRDRRYQARVDASGLKRSFRIVNKLLPQGAGFRIEGVRSDGMVDLTARQLQKGEINVQSALLASCGGKARLQLLNDPDGSVSIEPLDMLPCGWVAFPDRAVMSMQPPATCRKADAGFLCPNTADVTFNPGNGWRKVTIRAARLKEKAGGAIVGLVVIEPRDIIADLAPLTQQVAGMVSPCGEEPAGLAVTAAALGRNGTCPGAAISVGPGTTEPSLDDWTAAGGGMPDTICLTIGSGGQEKKSTVPLTLGRSIEADILKGLLGQSTYPIKIEGRDLNSIHDVKFYSDRTCTPGSESRTVAFEQASIATAQASSCSAVQIMWGKQPQSDCIEGVLQGKFVIYKFGRAVAPEKRQLVVIDNSESLMDVRDRIIPLVRDWAYAFQKSAPPDGGVNVELLLTNGRGDLSTMVKADEWHRLNTPQVPSNHIQNLDNRLDKLSFNAGTGKVTDIINAIGAAVDIGTKFDTLLLVTGRMPPDDAQLDSYQALGMIKRKRVVILAPDEICTAWRAWEQTIKCEPIDKLSDNVKLEKGRN